MTTEVQLTNAQLMTRHLYLQALRQQFAEEAHAIEVTLKARMVEAKATVMADGAYEARLEYPTPTYDRERLRDVLELVPEDVRAKGYEAAHTETVEVDVPDRFDMRQVKTWPKYGSQVAAILEDAKIQGEPRLKVSRKE